jgi:hypothetical protein
VYRPKALIDPQVVPEQPAPATLQVTFVLVVPVTMSMNCCVWPTVTRAAAGVTSTTMGTTIVTDAEAEVDPLTALVAVTVTVAGLGATAGAV